MDLAIDNDAIDHLRSELSPKTVYAISGASRQGVEDLLAVLWKILLEMKTENSTAPAVKESPHGVAE